MTDELFDDPELDAAGEFYARWRAALLDRVAEFAEAEQLAAEQVSDLLLDIGLGFATVDYLEIAEKPSVSGLRLHLDRLRRDFDEMVRFEKKHADERMAHFRATLEAIEGQDTGDEREA